MIESLVIFAPAISPSDKFNFTAVIVVFAIFAPITALSRIALVSTASSASSEAPIALGAI